MSDEGAAYLLTTSDLLEVEEQEKEGYEEMVLISSLFLTQPTEA